MNIREFIRRCAKNNYNDYLYICRIHNSNDIINFGGYGIDSLNNWTELNALIIDIKFIHEIQACIIEME